MHLWNWTWKSHQHFKDRRSQTLIRRITKNRLGMEETEWSAVRPEDKMLLEKEGDSGTTANVVIIAPQWVVCANAGDSRAVFSKHGNKAVPLSYDHKPDDEEEERRIRAAGGYVAGGRVEGDLAVSRGLGDFRFKSLPCVLAGTKGSRTDDKGEKEQNMVEPEDQKVSPVPDVIIQNRSAEKDEFIIVACDGIWDVQTNYECVKTVAEMFQEGESNMGLICEEVCDFSRLFLLFLH
jgi:serine/threonine protein phosphatase PrpC